MRIILAILALIGFVIAMATIVTLMLVACNEETESDNNNQSSE